MSGAFIVNGYVCWRRHHHSWKSIAPHFVLPQSPPVFVIQAVALLTHTGLPVQCPWLAACKHALLMAAVRDFHSKRTCLLAQTSPFMKVDCSALRAPTIAAGIRNPSYRSSYSYWLARPISMTLRVPAHSGSWLLSGTFIVKTTDTAVRYQVVRSQ